MTNKKNKKKSNNILKNPPIDENEKIGVIERFKKIFRKKDSLLLDVNINPKKEEKKKTNIFDKKENITQPKKEILSNDTITNTEKKIENESKVFELEESKDEYIKQNKSKFKTIKEALEELEKKNQKSEFTEEINANEVKEQKKKKKRTGKKILTWIGIFFLILFLIAIAIYISLKIGIRISSLEFGRIQAQNIFLKFDKKIIFRLDKLVINEDSNPKLKQNTTLKEMVNSNIEIIKKNLFIFPYFQELWIKNIVINSNNGSIKYDGKKYEVNIPSLIDINFDIKSYMDRILFDINEMNYEGFKLKGNLEYDINKTNIQFNIDVNVDKHENIELIGSTNLSNAVFQVYTDEIKSLNFLKKYIDKLPEEEYEIVNSWVFDQVKFKDIKVKEASFDIHFDDVLNSLLDNTRAVIEVNNVNVFLDKKVEAIHANMAKVQFQKREVKIITNEANFDNAKLSGIVTFSKLPSLNINIKLNARELEVGDKLKEILRIYDVEFPVYEFKKISEIKDFSLKEEASFYEQIKTVDEKIILKNDIKIPSNIDGAADLQIDIFKNEEEAIDVIFYGTFGTYNTKLKVFGLDVLAKRLRLVFDISPNKKVIYIDSNEVALKDVGNANIISILDIDKQELRSKINLHNLKINKENIDSINFDVNNIINPPILGIYLDKQKNILMNKLAEKIEKTTLRKVMFEMSEEDQGEKINHENLKGATELIRPTIEIKKEEEIDKSLETSPKEIDMEDNKVKKIYLKKQIKEENIEKKKVNKESKIIDAFHDSKVKTNETIKEQNDKSKSDPNVIKKLDKNEIWENLKIKRNVKHFKKLNSKELEEVAIQQIKEEQKQSFIEEDFLNIKNKSLDVKISFKDDIKIDIEELFIEYKYENGIQNIIMKDISNIVNYSPILKFYGISEGNANITFLDNLQKMNFDINLKNLDYPIYDFKNIKIKTISLHGDLDKETLIVKSNNTKMSFKSENRISLLIIDGYKFNLDEAFKSNIPFLKNIFKKGKEEKISTHEIKQNNNLRKIKKIIQTKMGIRSVDFNINAHNIQIQFFGYTIPFERGTLRLTDKIYMDGTNSNGIAKINISDGVISVKARNFSGDLINKIFLSKQNGKGIVKNGLFNIDGAYNGGVLSAIIDMQNTSFVDLKIISNVFALVDAVPSLIAFKNPEFSTNGYNVEYGKVLISANEDYIGIENMVLIGSSMDVNSQGIIDMSNKEMNMNLNISTIKSLSRLISNVPIIGYLILGKDGKISTNLILSGKYDNPKVNITLASDIIKAPFNIIRRVFTPVEEVINTINK